MIINSDFNNAINIDDIKNYKKLEFLNILFYSFSNLIKVSPHSTLRLIFPNYEDKVDFYYHSNSEIPCNKIDKSISFLFSILDLNIIIKVIFMLLTNKSVEFVSSSISILSNLIPAFLKLIYPIKFDYSSIPVVPIKDTENLSNQKRIHCFGLINKDDNFNKKFSQEGCVIVDCDTNQMYRYQKYVNFCPLPSSELSKNKNLNLKYFANKIQKYEKIKGKDNYHDVKFLENGKIIIDCEQENSLVLEHNDSYLTEKEFIQLRKQINYIKNLDLNLSSIDKKKINKRVFNPEREERNFDYKINKLFTEMIYNKLINQQEPLAIDMRILKSFMKFKQDFEFDNNSPKSIMKNIKIFDEEFSFFNSFVIKQEIFDFPFNEAKNFFDFEKFNEIYSSYNIIKENFSSGNLKSEKNGEKDYDFIHNIHLNFYGENGVFNLFNLIKEKIKDKEKDFFLKCYNEKIFNEIKKFLNDNFTNDFNLKNEETQSKKYLIEFLKNDNSEINYSKNSNFYLYLAFIFEKMKEANLSNQDFDINSINNQIINYYILGYKYSPHNFTFLDFYKFLDKLSLRELNETYYFNNKTINKCLVKIIENIRDKKVKEEEIKVEKLIKDKFDYYSN